MGISRSQVIIRAMSWLRPPVPYSQTGFHTNEYGTYRTDCSGYVSMAWALPGKPPNRHGGLNTIELASVSFPIEKLDLTAGDVVLHAEGTNLSRHVAIFEHWADDLGNAYWGFEQAGGTGTIHRIIAYPYESDVGRYRASRYIAVVDD